MPTNSTSTQPSARSIKLFSHVVGHKHVKMDQTKVTAIDRWLVPKGFTQLQSFLGLVNYYQKFIRSFSWIMALLTDQFKKDWPWRQSAECQQAFDQVCSLITSKLILQLPNFSLPFEIYIDASNFAIENVLMQSDHLVMFKGRKLSNIEHRYLVHEKEMATVIHCMQAWHHYLFVSHFLIFTNNVPMSCFASQKKSHQNKPDGKTFLLNMTSPCNTSPCMQTL